MLPQNWWRDGSTHLQIAFTIEQAALVTVYYACQIYRIAPWRRGQEKAFVPSPTAHDHHCCCHAHKRHRRHSRHRGRSRS